MKPKRPALAPYREALADAQKVLGFALRRVVALREECAAPAEVDKAERVARACEWMVGKLQDSIQKITEETGDEK